MQPLSDAHREFVLGAQVLHADETPVNMLDPGAGKTKRACIWADARGSFDKLPGVAYDFCVGRGAQHPMEFLGQWSGTLVRDEYSAYDNRHWAALTANLQDGRLPVDNNHIENLTRHWAIVRKAWLFCASDLAGQRAALVMSLEQSAKLNGHDPWAYLKDVLTRLPTHLNSRIDELLPHRWQLHA